MIELRCEYLSLQFLWLYFFVMSRTNFRLNPQSLLVSMLSILLLEAGTKSEVYVIVINLEPATI